MFRVGLLDRQLTEDAPGLIVRIVVAASRVVVTIGIPVSAMHMLVPPMVTIPTPITVMVAAILTGMV